MRVAVVTTSYPSHDGDPSGHFVQAEVAELEGAGDDVTVVDPVPGRAFGWPGVAARLRARPWHALDAAAFLARASWRLRQLDPDRVIAHWAVPSAWPIAAALPRADLDIVSHGGDVRLLIAVPEPLRGAIVRSLTARASRWRFVSSALLEGFEAALTSPDARALRRVALVAASPARMLDVRERSRARRSEIGDRRLYVCAGRLVPSKRVDEVIDYVASRRDAPGPAPVLVVLGDGPERARLDEIARRWRMDVRFLGTTSRADALAWLGAADEVVHASRAEGLSTVVREAEHLGVPVTFLG